MKKITKILSLGILFLFAFSLQLSAQQCKYNYDKKDPLTGEDTKGIRFSLKIFWSIGFNKNGNTYSLFMEHCNRGVLVEPLYKGDQLIIKLLNGEIITLSAPEDIAPSIRYLWAAGDHTFYTGEYGLDVVTLQKIIDNPPTYIRINIGKKFFDQEILEKERKQIVKAAKCILQ